MSHTVYIGIGSNLGERLANCGEAVRRISQFPGTRLIAVSKWRETKALTGGTPQPVFINGAVKITTGLPPRELLEELKKIEVSMGRPAVHAMWSPRTIDLDILFYDDIRMETPELTIPHTEIYKRTFVLDALCDIGGVPGRES